MCTCFYLKIGLFLDLILDKMGMKPLKGGLGVSDQGDVHMFLS